MESERNKGKKIQKSKTYKENTIEMLQYVLVSKTLNLKNAICSTKIVS